MNIDIALLGPKVHMAPRFCGLQLQLSCSILDKVKKIENTVKVEPFSILVLFLEKRRLQDVLNRCVWFPRFIQTTIG